MSFDEFVTLIFLVLFLISGGIYYGSEIYNRLRWR